MHLMTTIEFNHLMLIVSHVLPDVVQKLLGMIHIILKFINIPKIEI